MLKLSATIVQKKIASLRDVEEALARQVLYGGDLVTNLLEKADAVDERALVELLAESLELEPAAIGELPRSSADILRLVPGDVALRYGLYPLGREEQRLVVAVSERLTGPAEQELAFALGFELVQRACPLVRIRQAISRDYDLPLDRRSQRAVARLEGMPDPNPSIVPKMLHDAPQLSALPRPPSIPPIGVPTSDVFGSIGFRHTAPEAHAGRETRSDAAPAVKEQPAESPVRTQPAAAPNRGSVAPTPTVTEPQSAPEPELARSEGKPSIQAMPAPKLSEWSAEQRRSQARSRNRHRGPYTAADAEKDLIDAQDRDHVLSAFFDFAKQYFGYSALFAVHGELAEGRDAHGPGADRTAISGIGVPLDLPSSLARARTESRWSLAPLEPSGLDARLAGDLQRPLGKKVLLLPVTVRGRCVLIFYGDDDDADVELSEIGDVIAFAPLVASALENVILKRKSAARGASSTQGIPPMSQRLGKTSHERAAQRMPSADARAEALVQALGESQRIRPRNSQEPLSSRAPQKPDSRPRSARPKAKNDTPAESPSESDDSDPAGAEKDRVTPTQGTPVLSSRQEPRSLSSPIIAITQDPSDAKADPDADRNDEPRNGTTSGADEGPEISIGTAELDPDIVFDEVLSSDEPEESRSFAAAPTVPNKGYSSEELKLPKVIVDVGADCDALVRALVAGDDSAMEKLRHLGRPAVTALMAHFPGPIRSDPSGSGARIRASECGPVLKTLALLGPIAAPSIVARTTDPDPNMRGWATRLLGECPTAESAQAIARRVVDKDSYVRRAALDAGSLLETTDERIVLRDTTCSIADNRKVDTESRTYAIEALARWRDPRTVPRLIPILGENSDISPSALWALRLITRYDAGTDVNAWRNWWEKNSTRHRIEWLIEALMSENQETRREAGEELKSLAKEYFGYYDDLPKTERAKAQKRYRDWWETTGKARFFA